jgi:hypothetical protein
MAKIIGRKEEMAELNRLYNSDKFNAHSGIFQNVVTLNEML